MKETEEFQNNFFVKTIFKVVPTDIVNGQEVSSVHIEHR